VTPDPQSPGSPTPARPVRVALDLLGGDDVPEVVIDAALAAADALGERVELILVGPPAVADAVLAARGAPQRLRVVAADSSVAMDEDPVRAVRSRRHCSIRVATTLVRDGEADAVVSVGHTGASLAAAVFGLDRLPGVTRPAVAVLLPTPRGQVVLLDAGGTPDAGPDLLAQFALVGSAYARALGVEDPRVGLLTIGTETGKGDELRRRAAELLDALPLNYVGGVEGGDLARGGPADVVVTDGFTGNVVLKAIEGAVDSSLDRVADRYDDAAPARALARELRAGAHAGAVLLGVDGVSIVGHGASTRDEVAAHVALAVQVVERALIPRTAAVLSDLVALRRGGLGAPTVAAPAGPSDAADGAVRA
jgi:glycerol-3-phosphate acyltransferase PlsX